MDTEKFIERVKNHPILYNRRHKEYTNTAKKGKIWEDIARDLDIPSDLLKIKWKGLKDSYNKYKKDSKGISGSTKYHNWCWGPHLTFLDDCGNKRNIIRNVRTRKAASPPRPTSTSPVSLEVPIKHEIATEDDEHAETTLTFVTPTPSTMLQSSVPLLPNPLFTQSDNEDGHALQSQNQLTKIDAVHHLFMSYSETFKKFSVCTQAKIKVEMAKLFADAEVQEYNLNQMQSSNYSDNYKHEHSINY